MVTGFRRTQIRKPPIFASRLEITGREFYDSFNKTVLRRSSTKV